MKERLQKVLAHAGVASRRAAERLIKERRVRVNGSVIDALGTQIDPAHDRVEVDGRLIARTAAAHAYVALNKPTGVVSTAHDPQGRPTVVSLLDAPQRLYPVGRLDIDSEGLVLLTDDGELTFRLTHARFGVEKEYHVLVDCPNASAAVVDELRRGVRLEDGLARAVRANLLRIVDGGAWLRVVLVEGRQRQVRRMLAALDCRVEALWRVRIGTLLLGDLPTGRWRRLQAREVAALRQSVGLEA